MQAIIRLMAAAATRAYPEDLQSLLEIAKSEEYFDNFRRDSDATGYPPSIPYAAIALMPAWGADGLKTLRAVATHKVSSTALASYIVLTAISIGRIPMEGDFSWNIDEWSDICRYEISERLPQLARQELRASILVGLTDGRSKSDLLHIISTVLLFADKSSDEYEKINLIMSLLVDTHLILNEDILSKFDALLNNQPEKEEDLHQYILAHPILLDPFMIELRNKHELGSEFITDFVIRRINNDYVLVEIENSTDKLFRQDGSFTSNLMKAIAQVRDFQAWIIDNLPYAQTKLPGIRHPDGIVVIGRRKDLSTGMIKRLDEENFSRRGHIKILTYDDLLDQARVVYKNMLEVPIVFRMKDQKN